jgi:hypothetical protein
MSHWVITPTLPDVVISSVPSHVWTIASVLPMVRIAGAISQHWIVASALPSVVFSSVSPEVRVATTHQTHLDVVAAGPKGDGIVWRGDYSSSEAYEPLDAVAYNGSSYVCIVACIGVAPTDAANWSLMASASGDWTILDLGTFA